MKRYNTVNHISCILAFLISLAALYGSSLMLIDPSGKMLGMENFLPYFSPLPLSKYLYQNYIFPGIALFSIICVPNFICAILLLRKKSSGIFPLVMGIVLSLWITIQFIIFPANALDNFTFGYAIVQFIFGYMTFVFYHQVNMKRVKFEDYQKKGNSAVVYFSRLGYTENIAYEIAKKNSSSLIKVETKERTEGTLGFWWCGRSGLIKEAMEITPIDLSSFDSVTVCTPILLFTVSSPISDLLEENKGKIKKLVLVMNHFQPCSYRKLAKEIVAISGSKEANVISVESRLGKERKRVFYNIKV